MLLFFFVVQFYMEFTMIEILLFPNIFHCQNMFLMFSDSVPLNLLPKIVFLYLELERTLIASSEIKSKCRYMAGHTVFSKVCVWTDVRNKKVVCMLAKCQNTDLSDSVLCTPSYSQPSSYNCINISSHLISSVRITRIQWIGNASPEYCLEIK